MSNETAVAADEPQGERQLISLQKAWAERKEARELAAPVAPVPAAAPALVASTEGIATVELTEKEIAALAVAPDPNSEIDIKGDGIVFMPGVVLRERLCRALGPGKWALKAEAPARWIESEGLAVYDGSLWVKGKYVARAMGQCEWRPTNTQMKRTDALEGAKTDCLRRCCKDLGIGSILWHKEFVNAWKAQHAERYKGAGGKMLWRRKTEAGVLRDEGEGEDTSDASLAKDMSDDVPQTPPADPNAPTCPDCGSTMLERTAKGGGKFYGCSRYPDCRKTVDAKKLAAAQAPNGSADKILAAFAKVIGPKLTQEKLKAQLEGLVGGPLDGITEKQRADLRDILKSLKEGDAVAWAVFEIPE